jgi:hypothetical protein
MGRPTGYSEAIANQLLEHIAEGESLRSICLDPDMPGLRTVFDWLDDHEDFRIRYARAREIQGDVMDDKILQTANDCTEENAHSSKVKISAYQWRAMKLAPKKYGDKVAIGGAEDLGPIQLTWKSRSTTPPETPQ